MCWQMTAHWVLSKTSEFMNQGVGLPEWARGADHNSATQQNKSWHWAAAGFVQIIKHICPIVKQGVPIIILPRNKTKREQQWNCPSWHKHICPIVKCIWPKQGERIIILPCDYYTAWKSFEDSTAPSNKAKELKRLRGAVRTELGEPTMHDRDIIIIVIIIITIISSSLSSSSSSS